MIKILFNCINSFNRKKLGKHRINPIEDFSVLTLNVPKIKSLPSQRFQGILLQKQEIKMKIILCIGKMQIQDSVQ